MAWTLTSERRRPVTNTGPESYDPKVDKPLPQASAFNAPEQAPLARAWDAYRQWINSKMELEFQDPSLKQTGDAARTPSLRDVLSGAISGVAETAGADPRTAQAIAGKATPAAEFLPGVGTAASADASKAAYGRGDYGEAALEGLGGIPFAGHLVGAGAHALAPAAKSIVAGLAARLGEKEAAKVGKEAITAVNLRRLPKDEAMDVARSERHIIPKTEKQGGGFSGAPVHMRNREDLERLRANFDRDVGAGVEGADWYERAQAWIKRVAGENPADQKDLAQSLALFSSQADPDTNLGFHLQAAVSNMMGEPKDIVRTGDQAAKYRKHVETGEPIFPPTSDESKKTAIYGQHLDPTAEEPVTGTNDIWHARAWGYTDPKTGKPWDAALSPQQHSWLDAETLLAEDRANQQALGGRTDWTSGRVQAAPWVANKARGLEVSRKLSPEDALKEASKSYPEFEKKYTAFGTHEATPGKTTGILPSIASGTNEQKAMFAAENPWWMDENTGRDVLYSSFPKATVAPTTPTVGVFKGDVNPGQAARPLVPMTGESGARVMDPTAHKWMKGTEGYRAYVDAQDMGAYSMPIFGNKVGEQNAYEIGLPRSATPEDVNAMGGLRENLPNAIDYGGGRSVITKFGPRDDELFGKKAQGSLLQSLQERFGNEATVRPATLEGDTINYEPHWPKPEGSGDVTREMLNYITPQHEAAFDRPEVRQRIGEKLQFMLSQAEKTGDPLRKDYVTALQFLSMPAGLKNLRENVDKGILPAGMAAVLLPYVFSETGAEPET